MKIKLNADLIDLEDVKVLDDLINYSKYKSSKNLIFIQNGFLVKMGKAIKEDDEIFIIPKDMPIHEDDMQCFLSSRHSPALMDQLKGARVAVLGLGGLGSNTAMNLARTGIAYIKLIDFDVVDPSNLNRQNYYLDQIGMSKTEATLENLKRVNPYLKYETCNVYLDQNNYDKYLNDVDIIVEAFDDPVSKANLSRYFLKNYREAFSNKYLVASSGMAGYYKSNLIETMKLRERFYICGDFENSAKEYDGLMASRVNIVAGHQSNCVVRILMQKMEV